MAYLEGWRGGESLTDVESVGKPGYVATTCPTRGDPDPDVTQLFIPAEITLNTVQVGRFISVFIEGLQLNQPHRATSGLFTKNLILHKLNIQNMYILQT